MAGGQYTFRDDTPVQILNSAYQDLKGGQLSEAIEALERVLEVDVDYPGVASALKSATFWKERLDKDRAPRDDLERGELLLAQWRVFQAFYERLGDVPERCLFALKQHVFSVALASYLAAAGETEPGDPDVLLQVGRCFKAIGNYERALETLEKAHEARREDARILAELADCYSLVNESRSAKVFLREAFFVDPQAIDLGGLESPLVVRLADRVRALGHSPPQLAEWMPVYGAIWGVFNVKRELKPVELGKLKQAIYQMERDLSGESSPSELAAGRLEASAMPARSILVPRLINRYFWLIDHYVSAGESRQRIDEVLAKIRALDPQVHRAYTS